MPDPDEIALLVSDTGLTREAFDARLAGREVAWLPGGVMTMDAKGVLHIHVRRRTGLYGRRLIRAVHQALVRFAELKWPLYCPVKFGNKKAMDFVKFFGFVPYASSDTHHWFVLEGALS